MEDEKLLYCLKDLWTAIKVASEEGTVSHQAALTWLKNLDEELNKL